MNTPVDTIDIRCLTCATWFPSPVFVSHFESWETLVMVGNTTLCPSGHITGCNKENMRVRFKDGGFLGDAT